MLKPEAFRQYAHQLADWMADYYAQLEELPVKSAVKPREIFDQLPDHIPFKGEGMDDILNDFEKIIMPGITHWQHPAYHAYFPANSSFESLLAEMLTATLAAQCMIWDTSPAAAELEEKMMDWLKAMVGIPAGWSGVIQDTASTATLASLLTAREVASDFGVNEHGLAAYPGYRIYASQETHSSIEKAVKIAGFGRKNFVPIPSDENLALWPEALKAAIEIDLAAGLKPLAVVATLGTTGTTAIDPIYEIAQICETYGVWFHIDAAFAGTALALPECRYMIDGIELADSFVFNPHKWMFTNFDCTAYFVKDPEALVKTFEILPEYLKTQARNVNNYRDWGIPLGRRFRALKLWFVMRSFGLEGIRARLRHHIALAHRFADWVKEHPDFELMAPVPLSLVCFRYHPQGLEDEARLDQLNESLLQALNATGKAYLTHTKVKGMYTLRIVTAQTYVEERHVQQVWSLLQDLSQSLAE